ncbi:hypothetical protein [Bartonella henselae]|uniref:hypothetical protein n=1 Tax=Bartonella henselae TaxID=38323 RepID=UPI001FD8CEFF|nr:hypothetical protein [Bartonella henselae]
MNNRIRCLTNTLNPQAGRLPTQSFLRALKALTHYMRIAYKWLVGCSYAIKYP